LETFTNVNEAPFLSYILHDPTLETLHVFPVLTLRRKRGMGFRFLHNGPRLQLRSLHLSVGTSGPADRFSHNEARQLEGLAIGGIHNAALSK